MADGATPGAAIGAMLPDLFRMVARSARATKAVIEQVPVEASLLQGMRHHLEVDAWFHDTQAFHEGEAHTRDALRETMIARAPLFAHVVLEMALDGALIRRHRAALRASVAGGIEGRQDDTLAALRAVSRGRTTAFEEALFIRVLAGVQSFALPDGYANPRGLAERLQGIRRRFGFEPLTRDEGERLLRALETIAAVADPLVVELESLWARDSLGTRAT